MFSMRSNYFRSVQLKVTVYFGKAKSKRKREKTENPIDNKKGCTECKHQVDTDLLCIYRKLAASVLLAPTPCALQMTQRNHDY